MDLLGVRWSKATGNEQDESWRSFISEYDRCEKEAAAFLDNLKNEKLVQGIESSLQRGSKCVAFAIPSYLLGTYALADFHRWASAQHLAVMVGSIKKESLEQDHQLVLSVAPIGDDWN